MGETGMGSLALPAGRDPLPPQWGDNHGYVCMHVYMHLYVRTRRYALDTHVHTHVLDGMGSLAMPVLFSVFSSGDKSAGIPR